MCCVLILAVALTLRSAAAEERGDPPGQPPEDWHRALLRDTRYIFSKRAWLDPPVRRLALSGALGGVALYPARQELREWVQEHRSPSRARFLSRARRMGHGATPLGIAALCFGASLATRNARERETGWLVLESAAFAAAGSLAGSFVLAAERPRDGRAVRVFDDGRGISLDAALAASIVSPLRHQYLSARAGEGPWRRTWKRALAGLLYAGAGLVAYQRMDADAHWAPDAWLGTATGLVMGELAVRARRSRAASPQPAPTGTAHHEGRLAPEDRGPLGHCGTRFEERCDP